MEPDYTTQGNDIWAQPVFEEWFPFWGICEGPFFIQMYKELYRC